MGMNTFRAGANINVGVFVTQSGEFEVSQSVLNDSPAGIAPLQGRVAPTENVTADPPLAARTGEEILVYDHNEREVYMYVGAAVAAGAFLKPNASGRAITAAAADDCGAVALQAGAADGEIIKVRPLPPGSVAP